jgi:hypothetical protein
MHVCVDGKSTRCQEPKVSGHESLELRVQSADGP